ncbi:hypothetical protein L7F22_029284 [Adiantum nelumboides]|nr:hypothetical protein [Adiantum nelumboides]
MGRLVHLLLEPEGGGGAAAGLQDGNRLGGASYYNGRMRTPPPSRLDTNILIVTSSLFAVLLLALCMHFTIRWALLHLCHVTPTPTPPVAAAASAPFRPAPSAPSLHVASLPSTLYHPLTLSPPATYATVCPICLSDFADGDRIRVLPHCQHGLHVNCIDTWLAKHSSCPTCRDSLLEAVPSERLPSHLCLHILITKVSSSTPS